MVIRLDADSGHWEGEVWSQSGPQGRVKDEVTRDPDPAQDKRQIQFRAHGVLLIGACLQSTLGEQGSCVASGGGEAAGGFRVKRQTNFMNISLGSKRAGPRNIWWSLQGAGPAQKAGTVKFGRQNRRKELGGR